MRSISRFPIKENIINDITLDNEFNLFMYRLSYYLNKSIIEGTYTKGNTSEDISIISNTVQKIIIDLSEPESPQYNPDPLIEINHIIQYQINTYELFIEKTKRLYNKENIEYIDKSIYLDNYSIYFKKFKSLIELLNCNIELAKIDHSFLNDELILKQLFNLKNSLNTIRFTIPRIKNYEPQTKSLYVKFNTLIGALKMKCEFLIDKWYARSKIKLIDDNLKHKNLFESNIYIDYEANSTLRDYKNKIIYLYEISGYKRQNILKKCFQEINRKNISDRETLNSLSIFELHTLIKYYKDEVKNLDLLKDLIPVFDKKTSNDQSNFYENFALHVAKQYCQNNYFSLYCEKLEDNTINLTSENLINKLDSFFLEYETIKNNTAGLTDNFFLQAKFLKYSLTIINNHLNANKDNLLDAVIKTKKFHTKLEQSIEEFEKKIQWSLKNNNYIFKLPYSESIIKYKHINIYLSSSFLLPKIDEDIVKEKRHIDDINQKLKFIYTTELQINEIHKLKEDYKIDNKKLIETVTLFTAVISFIVGSIGGFKFVTDIYSAISFTITFGLSLMTFVLIIMRLLKKERITNGWDFGFLTIILAFIAILTLNLQKTLKQETITPNTDSANTIKLKIEN